MTDADPKTILVVDDQADPRLCPMLFLKERGFAHALVVARSGADALDYLHGRGRWDRRDARPTPDLVVVGLRMRRAADVDFIKTLRSHPRFRYLVIVMLVGGPKDCERLGRLGADGDLCMPKPRQRDEVGPLAERIATLLN